MTGRVLILAGEDDLNGSAVAAAIERAGGEAIVRLTAGFPARLQLSYDPIRGEVTIGGARPLSTVGLTSVWWRRPGPFRLDDDVTDPRVRRFCLTESEEFFRGAFEALPVPIVNPSSAEQAARKPGQLALAHQVGWRIPATLISNDPDAVRGFWRAHDGRCIYKPITAPTFTMAETRALTEVELADLTALRHAPIIVQEHVPLAVDVRVAVIGAQVFATEVATERAEAAIDWRLDLAARWRPHELPAGIRDRSLAIVRALGLDYGFLDVRVRPDGEYVFFKVNPSGQFLFMELDGGQPVTDALAALLLAPGR